jgi:hypothetical protein
MALESKPNKSSLNEALIIISSWLKQVLDHFLPGGLITCRSSVFWDEWPLQWTSHLGKNKNTSGGVNKLWSGKYIQDHQLNLTFLTAETRNISKIVLTAAMEGTPARPGGPWETSIPNIMVGILDTRGMEWFFSLASSEFNPPSWLGNGKNDTFNFSLTNPYYLVHWRWKRRTHHKPWHLSLAVHLWGTDHWSCEEPSIA